MAAGLCGNCGRGRPDPGLKICPKCREGMKRYRDAHPRSGGMGRSVPLRPIDYHHCEHCSLRGHTQNECDLRRAK